MEHSSLSAQAREIWQAGVDAVRSEQLIHNAVQCDGTRLTVCGETFLWADVGRIAVVGGGKAGAGMAVALEGILPEQILQEKVTGWVNVPADCVRCTKKIHLHAARPAGMNEPTVAGVDGSLKILELVSQLSQRDLCLVLLSGGGSALLPAPVAEISLTDKQEVTRQLMHAGATINDLNTVRKHLSRIKGGGLARASAAGRTISLIISDVVGDPLDVIASGPTVDDPSSDAEALKVLQRLTSAANSSSRQVPPKVIDFLERRAAAPSPHQPFPDSVSNHIIGNNALAVKAAAQRAEELGFTVHSLGSSQQGEANEVGCELARICLRIRDEQLPLSPPACVISGGEPVVHVVPTDKPRRGGRNQQLVLAAMDWLGDRKMEGMVLLSGGTDGEDGPTDAAGAWVDQSIVEAAQRQGMQPGPFLAINDSYTFFETVGGLLKTGPTHTNVMDLRIALIK